MPFHFSNCLLATINLITFLFSIPIILAGVWMSKNGVTECGLTDDTMVIGIGVVIMAVSLVGFIGSCWRRKSLLWLYLFALIVSIIVGLASTIFTFSASSKGAGKEVPGKGYKEYNLDVYSDWIQKVVNKTQTWSKVKACMVDTKVCSSFNKKYLNATVEKFNKERLNAIQSGCCKPSYDCGFTYQSPTNWTEEKGMYGNPDCRAWDNDPKVLCFNCQSCKAAVADNMRQTWKKEATVNIVFLLLLVIVCCIACCAFRNSLKKDKKEWHA